MQVRVTLRGEVVEGAGETEQVQLAEGASLDDLLAELAIAPQSVVLALVNETPAARATRLRDGDHVTLGVTS
jgi:sulfur carrier protein ThiS